MIFDYIIFLKLEVWSLKFEVLCERSSHMKSKRCLQ